MLEDLKEQIQKLCGEPKNSRMIGVAQLKAILPTNLQQNVFD